MAELSSMSSLVNKLTGGGTSEALWWNKHQRINNTDDGITLTSFRFTSMWRWDGIPGRGDAPTSAAALDRTANGALGQTNPGSGLQKWLTGGFCTGLPAYGLMLYDRLLHHGNASGTVTTAQTVGGTITRNTGGVGNQIWVEIYTAIGGTARTITASYTNEAGTSGRTSSTAAIGGTGLSTSSRMIQIPLADGDAGVQSVQSITLSATTGTAGAFGVTILRPVAWIPTPSLAMGNWTSFLEGSHIPEIETDACLAMALFAAGTSQVFTMGCWSMVEA